MSKRVLIVNVNWIGDVIFSTPFLRAVRMAYPGAHIACLLHPRCREVLVNNPCIDEIIEYDEEGAHRHFFGKVRLVTKLRAGHFDIAYILHRSMTKALLTLVSGIRERIGYATKGRAFLLTRAVPEPAAQVHKVDYFLGLLIANGIVPGDLSYEFVVADADRSVLDRMLGEEGIRDRDGYVVLCPGGNWDKKRWPAKNFARLADLISERLGARIVFSGASGDEELVSVVRSLMQTRAASVCGKTTLGQAAALFKGSAAVVANDSGPMHLAVAVGAKVVALFGPTSPDLTGPYGRGHYTVLFKRPDCAVPCYDESCRLNTCLEALTPEEVFIVVKRMISEDTGDVKGVYADK